jgi:polyisoprenoid-binding protein YceI
MKFLILGLSLWMSHLAVGQEKWFTRTGQLSFYSSTPVEDIEGISNDAGCVLDAGSKRIQLTVGMKSFVFEKALMQEHFNENYVESHKFPNATFKGELPEFPTSDFENQKAFETIVTGVLELHGVSKEITTKAKFAYLDNQWVAKATFKVKPQDFDIEIPAVVADKIADTIEVRIKTELKPLKR